MVIEVKNSNYLYEGVGFMNIYYHTRERNIFIHLKTDDRWYLIADQDIDGKAHLYLNVNGEEYTLMSNRELCSMITGMGNAMIS